MLDRLAQTGEVVERHRWKHVVLHMILHVPVEEGWEPTAGEGAAAKPKVRHIRSHPRVLGCTAEQSEPGAILAAEGDDQKQDPVAGGHEENRQEQVADQQFAGPASVFLAELEIFLRQDFGVHSGVNDQLPSERSPRAILIHFLTRSKACFG